MARERKIVAAFGAPGMGKSALGRVLISGYIAQHGTGSVRALDPSRTFEDLGVSEWPGRSGVEDWLSELTGDGEGPGGGGWGPGLVVLDDADRWLRPWIQEEVVDLFIANRHLGLDLFITAHRPQAVSKDLVGGVSELWLFAQEEPHALEYFMRMQALKATLKSSDVELPTEPGYALRVVPRRREVSLVDVFNR